jgi:mono/diheme cytochrome c family protein
MYRSTNCLLPNIWRWHRNNRCLLIAVALFVSRAALAADPSAADNAAFFESRVRPVFVQRCHDCHSGDAVESGLRVDSLAGLLKGGERGPAVVQGQPDKSLLVLAINHADRLHMPPKTKIPRDEIAAIAEWVRRGAPWPNAEPIRPASASPAVDEPPLTDEDRSFWAFQPPAHPPLPDVRDVAWVQSPIDRFVLARLEATGLQPAPPADKRTLIRRATFDLIGLPPTPDEVDAFLADESPEAFARLIDRLLASPQYGERWGRHWLDVARYGDSNGLDENLAFANAFRYRDYVVAALNSDKPYDVFLHEQLAGDLLPPSNDLRENIQRLVATGFLSIGAKMLAEDDQVKMEMDIIDEQVDTIGRTVMGLTLGCARCHDHKFDPIPTSDYYSLAGIFKSTRTMENFRVVARWQERSLATPEAVARQDEHRQRIADMQTKIDRLVAQANEELLTQARRHSAAYLLAAHHRQQIESLLKQAKPIGNRPDAAMLDGVKIIEAEDFARGNVQKAVTGYGEGIGVLVNKGETPNFVEYDIELPESRTYQFELRYAAASARPCRLSVNGRLVKSDVAGQVTGSWNPDTQTWFVEGFVPLQQGKNVLRLEHPQFFPHIDKLLLAPADDDVKRIAFPNSPRDGDYPINDEFVRQCDKYLQQTRDDTASIFAPWHALVERGSLADVAAGDSPAIARLLADPKPTALAELAARYQQMFEAADRAWQAQRASDAGNSSDTLSDAALEPFRRALYDPQGPLAIPSEPEPLYSQTARDQLARLREEKQKLEKSRPQLPEAMVVSDGTPQDLRIHIRGDHITLGAEVPRRFPRVLAGERQPPINAAHSGRLELAQWLTRSDHPLTARVMVNRVWQGHFGEALVRSPDNFGRLGQRPTHPELLDWLARRFVESGWSTKSLHRTIMLSSAYQMSTAFNERAAADDPDNRLLWRMNRRRLEAEAIRDAVLAAGGSLDLTMGGSLLPTENRKYVTSTASVNPAIYNSRRRSIYLPVVRSALYDFFQAFDFGDPSVINPRRDITTVAPQALFMMNSKVMAEQSAALADRLLADESDDDTQRVHRAYEIVFSRPPSGAEASDALHFVQQLSQAPVGRTPTSVQTNTTNSTDVGVRPTESPTPNNARRRAWQSLCRALMSTNEFIYLE